MTTATAINIENAKYVIGVDECGRGCLFGDVVAGACLLKSDLGADVLGRLIDSKKKSHHRRCALSGDIKTSWAQCYGIGTATVDEIECKKPYQQLV